MIGRLAAGDEGARRLGAVRETMRRVTVALCAACLLSLVVPPSRLAGQDAQPAEAAEAEPAPDQTETQPPVPLIEQDPYDVVTLDEKHESEVFKVLPIQFTGNDTRYQRGDHRLTDKLIVRLVESPDTQYEVLWRHIADIRLYEEMVLAEAEGIVAQAGLEPDGSSNGKLDEAYEYYQFLLRDYPDLPALKPSLQYYRFMNAAILYQQRRYAEALAILEDVYAADPNYRRGSATVARAMSGAIEQLMAAYASSEDFFHARKLLKRLNDTYKDDAITSIGAWRGRFERQAAGSRDAARAKLQAGELREAHRLSREMLAIWPDVPGGGKLIADIASAYPLIIVGVYDPALEYDASSLHNWGARRAGRIVQRNLMQYMGKGPSGGRYDCTLGTVSVSEDRRQVSLSLNARSLGGQLTAFDISDRLLKMARRGDPYYVPAWAALMQSVDVNDVYQVQVGFRRPFVLPEALMQVPVDLPRSSTEDDAAWYSADGLYDVVSREKTDALYGINSRVQNVGASRPVEIIERFYSDPEEALIALERGEIDMLDRLEPSDVNRLSANPSLIVQPYSLPTVHVLVPGKMNPFLEKTGFRRGLAYAINREVIMDRGILRSQSVEGCKPVSGPFIAGIGPNDSASYAYDPDVQPFSYDPVLGKILMELTLQELTVTAQKQKEKAPEGLPPLVIGYPAREGPRTACMLIKEQLQALEIEVQLKEFPPGVTTDPDEQCNLVYTELAMWEPVVDARRLLGDNGLAPARNFYVDLALQELDVAKTWKDARLRLNELHHYAHNEAVVIPLWQVAEHFVYYKHVRGIGRAPAYLYQDILQWRIVPENVEDER